MPDTPLSPKSFHLSITNALMEPDAIVPGRAELEADVPQQPVELDATSNEISSSSAGDDTSGDSSNVSSESESVNLNKCVKDKCTKGRCSKKGRRAKVVTSSEGETSENVTNTECSADTKSEVTDETQNTSSKGKKNKKKVKGSKSSTEASSHATTTDNDSSVNTGEVSTEAESSKASTSEVKVVRTNDDSGWSISEDCLLRGMKEGDQPATWAEIAAALNRSKNEVKARWKVIKDQPTSMGGETAEETEADTSPETDDKAGDKEAKSETGVKEAKSKAKGKQKVKKQTKEQKTKSIRNDKVAAENKEAKTKAKAKVKTQAVEPNALISSGEEASSEASEAKSSESSLQLGYGNPEKQREMRYLQDHIYKELYPPEIHPEPDAYFGKRDCDLLATIDSKYKRSRWLEMQANFFNVTGRMVPLEAIRAKCERAEEEKAERDAYRAMSRRLKKVEKWIQNVSQEEQEDPET
ncbi:hypothetical protein NM208_g13775 [Fusarium decemcellulare]|uniref:Uncharacterized protein n=1 Tax=Fusarium decemcellulare TaxID=57161 RepID=A0ACC1RKG4_9HYPO|nr:hypothetical protein NM208_g13775 [Fusarium decemcellulare]